jgi:hypothetical protein
MTKEQLVSKIAEVLGVDPPPMSIGSTEPRAIFVLANKELGLGLHAQTKQGMAREIVELAGIPWLPAYESRGATITKRGLQAVLEAVQVLAPEN